MPRTLPSLESQMTPTHQFRAWNPNPGSSSNCTLLMCAETLCELHTPGHQDTRTPGLAPLLISDPFHLETGSLIYQNAGCF